MIECRRRAERPKYHRWVPLVERVPVSCPAMLTREDRKAGARSTAPERGTAGVNPSLVDSTVLPLTVDRAPDREPRGQGNEQVWGVVYQRMSALVVVVRLETQMMLMELRSQSVSQPHLIKPHRVPSSNNVQVGVVVEALASQLDFSTTSPALAINTTPDEYFPTMLLYMGTMGSL